MPEYSPETYLASLLTTPEQEARNLRASRSRQRILALGDALRHIGNIYNTTQGAPAQQFNDPVTAERTRYQQDKLLRDANNLKYFNYQQAKQAQDAKQRQWEATFNYNMGRDAAKMQAQQAQWDTQNKERARQFDATLGYRRENDEANRKQRGDHYAEQERQGRQRIGIMAQNSANAERHRQWTRNNGGGGGNGSKVAPYSTPNGKIYHNGGNSADQYQMQQLYYQAKAIDDRHRLSDGKFEAGYKPLVTGSYLGSLMGGSGENYRQVSDALSRSGELADWAVKNLGWSYENGTSQAPAPLNWGGDDDDDDDDYTEEDYATDW